MSELTQKEMDAQELASLKETAKRIGLTHHISIGLVKLKARVNDHLAKSPEEVVQAKVEQVQEAREEPIEVQPLPTTTNTYESPDTPQRKRETAAQRKTRLKRKASRLIRFRLTCMNPNKKAWVGEIFTVSNSAIGTIKRHIPFHAEAWHCEEMLLNFIKEKQFMEHYAVKDRKGRSVKKHRLAREFSVEMLPPLTQEQIKDLAAAQAKANNLGDD